MTRPTYPDVMAAIDRLMLAHTAEVRGGGTAELRAAVEKARAECATLVYAATERPVGAAVPPDDPRLPIRRSAR